MVDLHGAVAFLTPYINSVEGVLATLSVFVGGIFGIYVVILIIRFITMRNIMKSHKEIKSSLKRVENKLDKVLKVKSGSTKEATESKSKK